MKEYHFNPGDKITCINNGGYAALFVGEEYEVRDIMIKGWKKFG